MFLLMKEHEEIIRAASEANAAYTDITDREQAKTRGQGKEGVRTRRA